METGLPDDTVLHAAEDLPSLRQPCNQPGQVYFKAIKEGADRNKQPKTLEYPRFIGVVSSLTQKNAQQVMIENGKFSHQIHSLQFLLCNLLFGGYEA